MVEPPPHLFLGLWAKISHTDIWRAAEINATLKDQKFKILFPSPI